MAPCWFATTYTGQIQYWDGASPGYSPNLLWENNSTLSVTNMTSSLPQAKITMSASQAQDAIQVLFNGGAVAWAVTDEGVIEQADIAGTPNTPASGFGGWYVKGDKPYFIDDSGTEYDLSSGGGGTPGGADTQIQFNDSGSFGASSRFAWDDDTLTAETATNTVPAMVARGASGQSGDVFQVQANGGGVLVGVTAQGAVEVTDFAGTPNTPASGFGGFYFKGDTPYAIDDSGTEYDLTSASTVDGGTF